MLKYIWKEKKNLIIIIAIILLCSIAIALGIFAQITDTKIGSTNEEKQERNYTELKNNFKSIFANYVDLENAADSSVNPDDIVYLKYDFQKEDSGKYNVNAKIPLFKNETKTTKKINQEITDTFAKKVATIIKKNTTNTIFSVDFVAYVNGNIVSLVIRGTLKEGNNPQRIMLQTYNYDLENDKLLSIDNIISIKGLEKNDVQNKINSEITTISDQTSNIEYNVYKRDPNSDIYQLQNTQGFFLGKNETFYIVYAYGNNNFTSVMDLIIF